MKYLKYIPLFFITVILISCKDDEQLTNPSIETESLIGLWKFEREFYDDEEATLDDCELKSTFEFKNDNTVIMIDYDFYNNVCSRNSDTAEWKEVDSNTLQMTFYDEDNPTTVESIIDVTYLIENGLLTLEAATPEYKQKAIFSKVN